MDDMGMSELSGMDETKNRGYQKNDHNCKKSHNGYS